MKILLFINYNIISIAQKFYIFIKKRNLFQIKNVLKKKIIKKLLKSLKIEICGLKIEEFVNKKVP
jgi:hypothetical protein